jgi:hypothetical protein
LEDRKEGERICRYSDQTSVRPVVTTADGHGGTLVTVRQPRLYLDNVEKRGEQRYVLRRVKLDLQVCKPLLGGPLSLETPIGDEEDSHLGDFIEDKSAFLPIDAAIQSNLRETTTRVLASLTPREEASYACALASA